MSKEIPDFNPGRVDIDADDDLGEEILDDGYGNNEAGGISDEEISEPLQTGKELDLGRKEKSSEVIDDTSEEKFEELG